MNNWNIRSEDTKIARNNLRVNPYLKYIQKADFGALDETNEYKTMYKNPIDSKEIKLKNFLLNINHNNKLFSKENSRSSVRQMRLQQNNIYIFFLNLYMFLPLKLLQKTGCTRLLNIVLPNAEKSIFSSCQKVRGD